MLLAAVALGAQLYATRCASCHGATLNGTAYAPPLRGVGMAALDFYLQTGRMPAAVPALQVAHRPAQLGPGEIAAIERALAPAVGAPTIPAVIASGDLAHGRDLYERHCQHCHAADGGGGDLGGIAWVPDLHEAPITQVAEAVRIGPGEMPRFSEQQVSQSDLNDVASYVMTFRNNAPAIEPPFRSTGPVPEGAIGWVAIILLVIAVFAFWRTETPPEPRA